MSANLPTLHAGDDVAAASESTDARERARLNTRIHDRRVHLRHTLHDLEGRLERRLDAVAEIPRKVMHAGRVGATVVLVGTTVLALAFLVRAMVRRFVAVGRGPTSRPRRSPRSA